MAVCEPPQGTPMDDYLQHLSPSHLRLANSVVVWQMQSRSDRLSLCVLLWSTAACTSGHEHQCRAPTSGRVCEIAM